MTAPTATDPRLAALIQSKAVPALVVVDVQYDFADPARLGMYEPTQEGLDAVAGAVRGVADLVNAARELGVAVVWVELGSDPSFPWRSSTWLRGGEYTGAMPQDEPCKVGTQGAEWFGVQPAPGEARIVKPHYSGFLGTGLADRLRIAGYEWLTVVGLTTECCVAATAEDAMQLGWPVTISSDATAAYDLDVNAAALRTLAINVGVVCSSADIVDSWKQVLA
ncbi:cysteine hydrolase family protein [Rathayibacter sp. CAU 1779]